MISFTDSLKFVFNSSRDYSKYERSDISTQFIQSTQPQWCHHTSYLYTARQSPRGPGPSRMKNFNPGIFRDRILPSPEYRVFQDGVFQYFLSRDFRKKIGIFRDFHFCFICFSHYLKFMSMTMPIPVLMC